jgi:predicted nucleic acid-binding protein
VKRYIVDTGALVALLDRADRHHAWAVENFKQLRPPLLTCESVFAEAMHLLQDLPAAVLALIRLHREGLVNAEFSFEDHASAVWRLMEKYSDLPMDFADACLVRMKRNSGGLRCLDDR